MAPEEGPMELRNVNAVVTGGASGLGRATAERLVAAGGRVALLDRPASAGADVAKTLGPSALFTAADVTRAEDVDAALNTAVSRFGSLNVLVNCSGIGTAMKTVGRARPDPTASAASSSTPRRSPPSTARSGRRPIRRPRAGSSG